MSMFSFWNMYLADVTLVNKLVEGVLSVSARLPPDDGSCVVVHTCAMVGYVLPIRLHVTLDITREVSITYIHETFYTTCYILAYPCHPSPPSIHSSIHASIPTIHSQNSLPSIPPNSAI